MLKGIFFTCIALTLVAVEAEDYSVSLVITKQAIGVRAAIELIGTFRSSQIASLNNNDFKISGTNGPFTVSTSKPLGDILQFRLTLTAGTNLFLSEVRVQYGANKLRTLQKQITVTSTGSVTERFPSPALSNPIIKDAVDSTVYNQQNPITLDQGASKSIIAEVQSTSNKPVTYRWYSQENGLSDAVLVSNSSTLSISAAKPQDTSNYFCVMSVDQSIVKSDTVLITINYLIIPPFTVALTDSIVIKEGDRVQITCAATTNEQKLEIEWKRGQQIITKTNVTVQSILTFDKIQRNDSGTYQCQAKSDTFTRTRDIHVMVNYLDKPEINSLKVANSSLYTTKNANLVLTCTTKGFPDDITYNFFRNGIYVNSSNTRSNTLTVTPMVSERFTCQVKNLYFTHSLTVYGNITNKTTPTDDSEDDEFWTTNVIVIVAMGAGFFVIFVLLLICICCLWKKVTKEGKSDSMSYQTATPHFKVNNNTADVEGMFYHSNGYNTASQTNQTYQKDHHDEDTLPSHVSEKQVKSTFRPSISSEEYKSSDAGRNVKVDNGKERASKQQSSKSKEKKKRSRSEEVDMTYTKVAEGYDSQNMSPPSSSQTVEYC